MDKVFVVTAGDYSDYHILGVYDTEEKAEKYVEYYNDTESWDMARIEEYPMNQYVDEIDRGDTFYFIRMDKDGNVNMIKEDSPRNYSRSGGKFVNDVFLGYVWAKDEGHAIKIMNERRIQKKAIED